MFPEFSFVNAAVVESGKRTGLCVSRELLLILGVPALYSRVPWKHQSDRRLHLWPCCVRFLREPRNTFLPLHTLHILSALSSARLCWHSSLLQTTYFSATCIAFFNIVNLASSPLLLLMLFPSFYIMVSLFLTDFLSCTLLDFPL